MSQNKGGEPGQKTPNASKPDGSEARPVPAANKPADDKSKKDQEAKPVDAPTARRRQDAIGRRLRQMYEDVVSEPVPDDFLSFLQQADNRGGTPSGDGSKPSGKDDKSKPGK